MGYLWDAYRQFVGSYGVLVGIAMTSYVYPTWDAYWIPMGFMWDVYRVLAGLC